MRLTLFNNPIEFIKFWNQLHQMAYAYCGNWFGVILSPFGKVMFINDDFAQFVASNMKDYDFLKR